MSADAPLVETEIEGDAITVTYDTDGEPRAVEVVVFVDRLDAAGNHGEWAVCRVHFDVEAGRAVLEEIEPEHRDGVPAWALVAAPVAARALREQFVFDEVVDVQRYLRDLFAADGGEER